MNESSLPAFVTEYMECFSATWSDETPASDVRFVVLDSETTGLDPRRDRLITIGAVAVKAGEIILADCFEAMLKVAYNSSSVTVHGITREEAGEGFDEPEALEAFLPYLRDGVIVGHHILHDIETLNAACERHFGFNLRNRFLDTMDLTLHLQNDGAFAGRDEIREFSLDALCRLFDVEPHDRHTAGGDAFITALVFLRLLKLGRRFGRDTLGALSEAYIPQEEEER
ncbi:MAG: 3'-5' exonuclease [Acidobacteria bacterium]|nr:3'-5' exonuclease [Acidobacteriota bacterium]MCW5968786.1 3'-5' exonuclease [Blastocatellales bacterium]